MADALHELYTGSVLGVENLHFSLSAFCRSLSIANLWEYIYADALLPNGGSVSPLAIAYCRTNKYFLRVASSVIAKI